MKFQNNKLRFINVVVYKPFLMKINVLILIIAFSSCAGDSQNSTESSSKDSLGKQIKPIDYTVFKINEIPDIPKGSNEKSPEFIKKRLELLIGDSYKEKCNDLNVSYPPKFVLFRVFKLEKAFEIWISNSRSDSMKLLATLPICAVDAEPGPKLKQGDGKTPEGFYSCSILYGSSNGFMWIKLNNKEIENFGSTDYGSSFKLCLEYPLPIDAARTRSISAGNNPGGAICIHGNCVTAGCISFENTNFLPIFLSARFHRTDLWGNPKIHIFPFRFNEELIQKYSETSLSDMNSEELKLFWIEIQKGYDLFNKTGKPIKVSFTNNTYYFSEY
jgi:murein L,D-transpeptidase YafK